MNSTENSNDILSSYSIFHLNSETSFNEEEALKLIDLCYLITKKTQNKINALKGHLNYNRGNGHLQTHYQDEINAEVQRWSEKIRRLGGLPLSLYKIKILSISGGYYIWEFPNHRLIHHFDDQVTH